VACASNRKGLAPNRALFYTNSVDYYPISLTTRAACGKEKRERVA